MNVHEQNRPEPTPIPGVAHATWAGRAEGLTQLSLWRQTLAPGAATPEHRHDCDEVLLCLSGWGELRSGAAVKRFGADQTVVLPRGRDHQIINAGPMPLEIVAILAATPVAVELSSGEPLALPWRS
jgi:mannose-6-phosphate isomerase-like protein (cupin superfamily)